MKVAIVSDTHFGYGWDSSREHDCFTNAREAFEQTVDADVVILPGDIYDHKVPKQEVLSNSIDCFNIYKNGECSVEFADESDMTGTFDGTPVVAIHGTHERRTKGFVNPIELLDKMNYLLHLHNEKVVFEHPESGEKVAIHGMSGVPERYAPGVLEKFDPEPVADAYNIFMFHQSVENFVYTSKEHDVLKLEHLPEGFDLLVDGHIHWYDLDNVGEDKPLILPGSTISTQMRKIEAEKPKGYVTVDTDTGDVEFHELDSCRDLCYEVVNVDGMSGAEIMQAVDERMDELGLDDYEKRPLIRIVLQGETSATVKLSEIRQKYEDTAILSCSKKLDSTGSLEASAAFQDTTKSVAEMGKDLLRTKLADAENENSLHVEQLFELLAEEQADAAIEHVEDLEVTLNDEPSDEDTDDEDPETADGTAPAAEKRDNEEPSSEKTITDFSSSDAT